MKKVGKLGQEQIDTLLKNGIPGGTCITQLIDGDLVSWWCPTLNDVPISIGKLEKFDNVDDATIRAIEIKRQAATKQAA